MTEEQTRKFVDAWNTKHNFPLGENTTDENMRYSEPGVVYWNAYDAPFIDVIEFVGLAMDALV